SRRPGDGRPAAADLRGPGRERRPDPLGRSLERGAGPRPRRPAGRLARLPLLATGVSAATPPPGLTEAAYEAWARGEVDHWRHRVLKPPGGLDRAAHALQTRINRIIPEKVHAVVTTVMERMTRAILVGADVATFTTPLQD